MASNPGTGWSPDPASVGWDRLLLDGVPLDCWRGPSGVVQRVPPPRSTAAATAPEAHGPNETEAQPEPTAARWKATSGRRWDALEGRARARSGSASGLLLDCLTELLGEEVEPDDEGMLHLAWEEIPLKVSLGDRYPTLVQVHAVLLAEVEASPALLTEMNTINEGILSARIFHVAGCVVVSEETTALDLTPARLAYLLWAVGSLASWAAPELREQFRATVPPPPVPALVDVSERSSSSWRPPAADPAGTEPGPPPSTSIGWSA